MNFNEVSFLITPTAYALAFAVGILFGLYWSGRFIWRPYLLAFTSAIRLSLLATLTVLLLHLPISHVILILFCGLITVFATASLAQKQPQ